MISDIDSWLLDKIFEPAGRFCQRWVGLDCLHLATGSFFWLAATEVMAVRYPGRLPGLHATLAGLWLFRAACLAVIRGPIVRGAVARGFANDARATEEEIFPVARTFVLAMCPPLVGLVVVSSDMPAVVKILIATGAASMVCGFYFEVCTPDPPSPSRLRRGLRRLGDGIRSLLAPTPLAAPA